LRPWILAAAALAALTTAAAAAATDAAPQTTHLVPDAQHERRIEPGGNDIYTVELRAGDYLAVDTREMGIDLAVSVIDPQGRVLVEQETRHSPYSDDQVRLIAGGPGEYRLSVTVLSADAGEYRLAVLAIRPATARDTHDVAAVADWQRGLQAEYQGTPEGLRAAAAAFTEAAAQFRANADADSEGRVQMRLGRVHFQLGEWTPAIDHTRRALDLYRGNGNHAGEAGAANNLGALYQETGQPALAIEYFTQALPALHATGDRYKEAIVRHNLGWYHQTLGEVQPAAAYYRQALPLWAEAGNLAGRGASLNNLGLLAWQLNDLDEAADEFGQALALRRQGGDVAGEAQTLSNLAMVQFGRRNPDRARELLEESLAAARRVGSQREECYALLLLAEYHADPASDEVAQLGHAALASARHLGDRRAEAAAQVRLGAWHSARAERDDAYGRYAAALALQRETADARGEAATLLALARLHAAGDELVAALDSALQAVDIIESLRGQVAQPDLRLSWFASVQGFYATLIDVLMGLHEREPDGGYDAQALQASERARARGLLDLLSEKRSNLLEAVDPRLVERERDLRRVLNARDQRWRSLLAGPHDAEAGAAAGRAVDEAIRDLHQLEGEIRARSPRYAELTLARPIDIGAVQKQLDADTVVLEYWLGAERSYVWMLSRDTLQSRILPGADLIEEATRRYFGALSARPPAQAMLRSTERAAAQARMRELAAEIGRILPAEIFGEFAHRRMIVVGHGAIEYLPLAALPSSSGMNDGAMLVDEREIVYLPSLSVLAAIRTAPQGDAPGKTIAVFADPVFSADDPRVARNMSGGSQQLRQPVEPLASALGAGDAERASTAAAGLPTLRRLRFSRHEAQAIAALVPASQRFEATDFRANRAAVLDGGLEQYRMVHFATHGLVNDAYPELSGLVLSAVDEQGRPLDALLRMHDIFGLSLRAELVVLSACQTALGREIDGEGLLGLTRAFMYAGAPRVIATLWNVDDRASTALMRHFYAAVLERGLSPAAALREAQGALRKDPRWASPYYWAGYVLSGEWR